MKVSDLINKHNKAFGEEGECVPNRKYSLEIGTKVATALIQRTEEIPREGKAPRISKTTMLKVETKAIARYEDCVFVSVKYEIDRSHRTPEGQQLTDDELNRAIQRITEYWIEYSELKGMNGVFYSIQDVWDPTRKDQIKNVISGKGMIDYSEYVRVFKNLHHYPLFGKVSEKLLIEMDNHMVVHDAIKSMQAQDPTFRKVESKPEANHTKYSLNDLVFYYENAHFQTTLDDKFVLKGVESLDGDAAIEGCEIEFNRDSFAVAIERVIEQKRLYNLIKPPIYHLKSFVKSHMASGVSDDDLTSLLVSSDEKIGAGMTEKESITLGMMFENLNRYQGKYKEIETSMYTLYRCQTDLYHWFILRPRVSGYKLLIIPQEDNQCPQEMIDVISKITAQEIAK